VSTPKTISAAELKAAFHDSGEIALLDAREEVPFDARHIFWAACMPLGRIETTVDDRVPRRKTRIVWCDDGGGLAHAAARTTLALGYTNSAVLNGGIDAWEATGFRTYSGIHVPSKAFAEVVEHEASTPHISVNELDQMIQSKADIAIFDTRSYEEYHSNSIPGAISVPGAELLYRFKDLTPSEETLVVVNCGGRTRSIIGAQALINAGVPNRVVSLKNGTQDWHLGGFPVLRGAEHQAPDVSAPGLKLAQSGANRIAALCEVRRIDKSTLDAWRSQASTQTLYTLDVRTLREYEAGHVSGVKHIAGGQLIQETDAHLTTWGARVVLFDDDGVRATVTASWLKQMGWESFIISNAEAGGATQTGPHKANVRSRSNGKPARISAAELKARISAGTVTVVDLNWSRGYYVGHIPGAWYAIRSRLDADLGNVEIAGALAFTSPDGVLAEVAAADRSSSGAEVYALQGGTAAWQAAGFEVQSGATNMASAPDDIRVKAREEAADIEAAMRAYLAWEIELVNDMANEDDHRFQVAVPHAKT
jgi:rhodanese-related sulfurtransferase